MDDPGDFSFLRGKEGPAFDLRGENNAPLGQRQATLDLRGPGGAIVLPQPQIAQRDRANTCSRPKSLEEEWQENNEREIAESEERNEREGARRLPGIFSGYTSNPWDLERPPSKKTSEREMHEMVARNRASDYRNILSSYKEEEGGEEEKEDALEESKIEVVKEIK